MKDKEQILEGHVQLTEAGRMVPISNAKFVMDEYAEEYLKEFIRWHNQGDYCIVNNHSISQSQTLAFKESLKK